MGSQVTIICTRARNIDSFEVSDLKTPTNTNGLKSWSNSVFRRSTGQGTAQSAVILIPQGKALMSPAKNSLRLKILVYIPL